MKTSPQKKTCTSMFNAALFILASNLKQSKYSQQDNGGLFMKRNTMQQLRKAMNTRKNTDFKSIFLSERSQTHRELNSRTSRRVYGNRRSAVTWVGCWAKEKGFRGRKVQGIWGMMDTLCLDWDVGHKITDVLQNSSAYTLKTDAFYYP